MATTNTAIKVEPFTESATDSFSQSFFKKNLIDTRYSDSR